MRHVALFLSPLLVLACSPTSGAEGGEPTAGSATEAATGAETGAPTTTGASTGDASTGAGSTGGDEVVLGHCVYTNAFTKGDECREYVGAGWAQADADADCAEVAGTPGAGSCDYPSTLGTCELKGPPDAFVRLVFPGADAGLCQATRTGCELFAGGTFTPSPLCEDPGEPPPDPDANVFQWPTLQCIAPLPGEPPGMSEGGDVCTWTMISGCTEEGRKFVDYGSCEPVLTQRPYVPVPPNPPPAVPDTRLEDPVYAAEQAWVTAQVEACACVCCHQTSVTPAGAGVWDIEGQGNWINTFSPYGLAFAGGFIDSSLLGAYPAAQNNGFDRATTGLPTTDAARMAKFFAEELAYRGMSPADFAGLDPTPKPFYDQSIYEPGACTADEGISATGELRWSGGWARYVYVLAADAANPGVPPNLDLPAGTLWRLDAESDGPPFASGAIRYGELPESTRQGFPAMGAPAPLVAGQTYYLYVLADIGVPITRCLFTN
jgi:hypothetical protein